MSRAKLTSIFAKFVLAAVAMSGMLMLGTPNAEAQSIIATTPFAFSAGGQTYPAGTYEFTLLSEWSLSIRNMNGGGAEYFMVHPVDKNRSGSNGSLTFHNSDGYRSLQAVYVPGTGRAAELLQHNETDDKSFASLHASQGKAGTGKQNATGR